MKKIFRIILKFYLKIITKIVLFIHKPNIIIVAGNTNKLFVKKAIKESLEGLGFDVRSDLRNFNTDISVPLSILSLNSGYGEYKKWLPIIYQSFFSIFKKKFPKYLLLNYTSSNIGDMRYLLTIAKPNITVITKITQKYIEEFKNINKMIDEYKELCMKTDKKGLVILNCDNKQIRKISNQVRAKVFCWGRIKKANFRLLQIKRTGFGEHFCVEHNKQIKKFNINKFGKHHVHAYLIANIIKNWYSVESKDI